MLSLVPETEEILHTKLEPFDFNNPPIDPTMVCRQLLEVMQNSNALGVSANQLGLPHRVFLMKGYPNEPTFAVFNPRIVNYSDQMANYKEGCLTYPGLAVRIKRPIEIRVRFQDAGGTIITKQFNGVHARVFQHEFDHMEGQDFMNKANFMNRAKAIKDWANLKRKMKG